jgi:hypothetical protein
MIASAAVYTVIYLAFVVDLVIPVATFRLLHQASFMLGSVYIIVLGFFGHRQGNPFSDKMIRFELQEPEPISPESYSPDQKEDDCIRRLLHHMNENKPYLVPEITLSAMASELDVTENWKPGELPFSYRLVTFFVRSFRTWPTTYKWTGTVDLTSNRMLHEKWLRKR